MPNEIEQSSEEELLECEQVLAGHMEEFVKVGLALQKIRDKKLYKVRGFETFEAYCKERWDYSRGHVYRLIDTAEIRERLPNVAHCETPWSQRSVQELKRLDTPAQQKTVATKVIKEVEKTECKLTASLVRKFVDKELGVERKNLTKEEREERKPIFNAIVKGWISDVRGIADVLRTKLTPDMLDDWLRRDGQAEALAYAFSRALEELKALWKVEEQV